MGLFDFLKKEKKYYLSKELFGQQILSKFILKSGENYDKLFEEIGKEKNVIDYFSFLRYLLFIANKILEEKFSKKDSMTIVNSALIGIVEFSNLIPENKKYDMQTCLLTWYKDFIDDFTINIHEKEDIHKLADCFIKELNIDKNFHNHLLLFEEFSVFIVSHTSDILNDKIILNNLEK